MARTWVDYGGTGSGLDDDAAAALPLPTVALIDDYATAVFAALQPLLEGVADDEVLERAVTDLYGDASTIGESLVTHLSHVDRHLGMIEALRGVLGERGTATV